MTVLADLIQRPQFQRDVLLQSIRKSVFWQSGVIVNDSELAKLVNANIGSEFNFDYFLDLIDAEPRISDDSNTIATTDNITTQSSRAISGQYNRSWGSKNITASLSSTGSPMDAITGRIGAWWARSMDLATMSVIDGIFASNVVNDASDMLIDNTGTSISIEMLLDGKQTSGDQNDVYGTLICHSAIETSLKKQGVIDRIYSVDSGEYLYSALSGMRIVSNDSVPSNAGNYTSYLVGGGVIGYGEGTPKRPIELAYDAATGNGSGEESIWTRKNYCLAPYGFSFTSATMAGLSPTRAELADATNWTRDVERKRVPLAAVIATV